MTSKCPFRLFVSIFLLLAIFSFNNDSLGFFQLLMSKERQKKIERIINYLDVDLSELCELMDKTIYDYKRGGKKVKKEVNISESFKDKVIEKSRPLLRNYEMLQTEFKSVYFVEGEAHSHYKKYFDSVKEYTSSLSNVQDGKNLDLENLISFYSESRMAKNDVGRMAKLVKKAKIENEEKIRQRIAEMSLWEWLFGY